MKKIFCVIVLFPALIGLIANAANALDKTSTGFYWPIGKSDASFNSEGGYWMSKAPDYFDGKYHVGVDMMTNSIDADVVAISDGTIKYISYDNTEDGSNWGIGNCALAVEHKKSDGSIFTAVYGHLRSNSIPSVKTVNAGKSIGKTGNWDYGIHLHFSIHDGTFNTMAISNWGMMPIEKYPDQNSFTDPIDFIKNNAPYIDLSNNFQPTEMNVRMVGNIAWYPSNVECFDAVYWLRIFPNYCEEESIAVCFEIAHTCPAQY